MSKAKASTKLLPFAAAQYLTDDAAVAEYMAAVLELMTPTSCCSPLAILIAPR